MLGSQQATVRQHLRMSGIHLHFDGHVASCKYMVVSTKTGFMPPITISCASQASSCVGYLWRSVSWCRTGRAFLAPESRSFCQFRLVCPKTWSETPEPGGTGHKAGPEKSEEQIQTSSSSCCQEVFEKHHKPESRSYHKLILYLLSGKKI